MKFADMTTEQFAAYVKSKLSVQPVMAANARGPRLPIYAVDSTDLPEKLTRLVNTLMSSQTVFDVPGPYDKDNKPTEAITTLAPHTPGKMRSYHGNIDRWLPPVDTTKTSSKSRKYAEYISTYKGQPNNLKEKAGGDTGQTGYIEYTAAGWRQAIQHGRLVFNYYDEIVYLTPHYQTEWFGADKSPFVLVNWRLGLGKTDSDGAVASKQASVWALSASD